MNSERQFPSGRVSEHYSRRIETLAAQAPVIPVVERYNLSSQKGWLQWEEAMRRTGKFSSTNIEGMIEEAINASEKERIYRDSYKQHMEDAFKIDQPGVSFEEYKEAMNQWEEKIKP